MQWQLLLLVVTFYAFIGQGSATPATKYIDDNVRVLADGNVRVIINGTDYYIGLDNMIWDDAVAKCESMGMVLCGLETEEKQKGIVDWLIENPSYSRDFFYIGGVRLAGSSQWRWISTNQIFYYTNWEQPFSPRELWNVRACLNIYAPRGTYEQGWWEDDRCFKAWDYICEPSP